MAEITAKTKYNRISPQKVREVAFLVRGKDPLTALGILKNVPQRPAGFIAKAVSSAVANARKEGYLPENLRMKSLLIEQGPASKRFRPASMGRAVTVLHRTTHIKVVLTDEWDKK